MAHILLLDESEVAGQAMQGILARGNHSCITATCPEEAWRILREGVVIDLLFLEPKMPRQDGLGFLQRLRDEWFWKNLPVIVYTYDTDAKQVRKALGLRVQNYLVKPYSDQLINAEIAKARLNPWRNLLFEEPKSFCAQLGLTPDALTKKRVEVLKAYFEAGKIFPLWAEERDNNEVFERIDALVADAEAAGVWAAVDYLQDLRTQAAATNWAAFRTAAENLDFASRLIYCHLNPGHVPDRLRTERDRDEEREAAERARWQVNVDTLGPVVDAAELEKQLAALSGFPTIDTAAASFQMAADGRAASMTHVMELVSLDPGLCVQVLAAANRIEHDDMTMIEDPKAAASLLGEIKLNKLARALPRTPERHMHVLPMTWPAFWKHLVGVGKVSQYICDYLELTYLSSNAFTAGLLHDVGKLVLLHLHPFGFQSILRYARERKVSLHEAERKHITWTSRELGVRFAEHSKLPPVYTSVIRWVETPALATEQTDLVAIVSLARHVCLHNHVGCSGETQAESHQPIASTAAWPLLQPRLFPSFDLKKFEAQAHAYCVSLRKELSVDGGRFRPVDDRAAATAGR